MRSAYLVTSWSACLEAASERLSSIRTWRPCSSFAYKSIKLVVPWPAGIYCSFFSRVRPDLSLPIFCAIISLSADSFMIFSLLYGKPLCFQMVFHFEDIFCVKDDNRHAGFSVKAQVGIVYIDITIK